MICFKEDGKLEGTYNEDNFLKEHKGLTLLYERVMTKARFHVSDLP